MKGKYEIPIVTSLLRKPEEEMSDAQDAVNREYLQKVDLVKREMQSHEIEITKQGIKPIDESRYIVGADFTVDVKPVDVSQYKLTVPEDGIFVKFARSVGNVVDDVVRYGTVAYWILRYAYALIEAINKLKKEKK